MRFASTAVCALVAATALSAGALAQPATHVDHGTVKAKVSLSAKEKALDTSYRATMKRVPRCAANAPQRARAATLRNAALRHHKGKAAAVRRHRVRVLTAAVRTLSGSAKKCGPAAIAAPGGASAPATLTPIFVPVPGGQGGSGGAGGSGGSGGAGIPGVFTGILNATHTLTGSVIDVSGLLGPGTLPQSIHIGPLGDLSLPLCSTVNSACIGVDGPKLLASVNSLTANVPLLAGITAPLVAQVSSAISSGNPASLLSVQRLGDTTFRVIPSGPLATLLFVTGTANAGTGGVATVQVVR